MSASTPPATWLPFDELIEQLNRKGFRIGVEHNVRLQALLSRVGDQCSPADLKTLLCPLFATSAQQQQIFYRAFDICYPSLRAEDDDHVPTSQVAAKERAIRRFPTWQKWCLALGLVAIAVATAITVVERRTPAPDGGGAVASPSPQPQPIVTDTSPKPWTAWYSARRTELRWVVVVVPLALWLAWELYRYRRRELLIRKSLDKAPPYSWPVRTDTVPEIYQPSELAAVSRLLHRRYQGESERLDVIGTIAASIASLGFPTFRYRRDSRLPEYLFLIDRAGFRDHQSRLYEHLATVLRGQGLYVSTWFFDDDPRVCWSAEGDVSVYLEQLTRSCPGHRCLLFGTGDTLLDPVTGSLVAWQKLFEAWTERAVLTPAPPARWSIRELTLATQFAIAPATLDGLRSLAAYFDSAIATGQHSDADGSVEPASRAAEEISSLRAYLGSDVFQWLCACAIYPELQWGLTLTLGGLPSMPSGLVCEENLTKLLQLEWFRTGSIPDERRRELIGHLDTCLAREAREAIVHVLEDSQVPSGTVIASAHSFQIAYQRVQLAPKDRKTGAHLKAALSDVSSHEAMTEHAALDVSDSVLRTRLDFVLPPSLRRVFSSAGVPLIGLRLSAGLAMALIAIAAGLQALRLTDRAVFSETANNAAGKPGSAAPSIAMGPPLSARPVSLVALTVAPSSGGTIVGAGIQCGTMGQDCQAEQPEGKVVKLTALADPDYTFKGFSGECAKSGEVVMNQTRRCGAVFVKDALSSVAAGGPPPSPIGKRVADPLDGRSASGGAGIEKSAPPITPESIAKEDIANVLEAFRKAYEARDVPGIKRLYPGASEQYLKGLQNAFNYYKSLEYTYTTPLEYIDLSPPLGTAVVQVGALSKPEYKGPVDPPQRLINRFTLKRTDGVWSIQNLKVEPVRPPQN